MLKHYFFPIALFTGLTFILSHQAVSQDQPVGPKKIITGQFLGITPPLSTLPAITEEEFREMEKKAESRRLNPWPNPAYPFEATALPKGPDPVWQDKMGTYQSSKGILQNWIGQNSAYYPSDANGCAGPSHYFQTVNTTYAIYSKTGTLLAGPTALNSIFTPLPGSACNDGDPIILYDENANRWLFAEFSLCETNDRMLIAISQTSDPTGSWYKYSFDVDDVPDYMKFGVWRDGYYMGTNTHNADSSDIYVFQRSVMLTGGANPLMVSFDSPWRPANYQGVKISLPADNDGTFAPTGSPGLFFCLNDDAIAGGSDQIWIFELAVNWTTPASSTFNRVQQLNVAPYDSNFGANWNNIAQPGTTTELCSLSDLIMNCPQYRNHGTYQTIVLCHTVDVDATDHAGVRWYELQKTTGDWSIRQQGTYAPDAHSRWTGSIRMNGYNQIGMGYSISSSTEYPGVRYCGQSLAEYELASGIMNVAEVTIQNGGNSQTTSNRWGDYAGCFVDPFDDWTFWFTTQYTGPSNARKTKIASFRLGENVLFVDATAAPGGNGSPEAPYQTVRQAETAATSGTLISVRNNTYDETNPLLLNKSGRVINRGGTVIIK